MDSMEATRISDGIPYFVDGVPSEGKSIFVLQVVISVSISLLSVVILRGLWKLGVRFDLFKEDSKTPDSTR